MVKKSEKNSKTKSRTMSRKCLDKVEDKNSKLSLVKKRQNRDKTDFVLKLDKIEKMPTLSFVRTKYIYYIYITLLSQRVDNN